MKLIIYDKWKKSRNEDFVQFLEHDSNSKVIDLGCGYGDFTIKIKEKIGCNEIFGVDIYESDIHRAKNKGIEVIKYNLSKFPYPFIDNSFDVVLSNQLIEHLFYPVRFIQEINRILKPNGYCVISTENLASWDNVCALILGYTPFSMEFDSGLYKIGNPLSPHKKEMFECRNPHIRIFTLKGLIELLRSSGFKIKKVVGNSHILFKLGEILDKRHCRFITIKASK